MAVFLRGKFVDLNNRFIDFSPEIFENILNAVELSGIKGAFRHAITNGIFLTHDFSCDIAETQFIPFILFIHIYEKKFRLLANK